MVVLRVHNITRDQLLGQRVERAQGFVRRFWGLLGRRGWGEVDGLWLEPCVGVHGLMMRFPIDVMLMDEGLVVLWTQTLRPFRIGKMHLEAQAALELPLGTLERTGTRAGDRLRIEAPDTAER